MVAMPFFKAKTVSEEAFNEKTKKGIRLKLYIGFE